MDKHGTVTTTMARPDPFKRVKYWEGMVLGAEDFEQEQGYFVERGRLRNRALHGYGTAYGLQVTNDGQRVFVSPGLAITPHGREMWVPEFYVADLDEWLGQSEHCEKELPRARVGNDRYALCVVLQPTEREKDATLIPGVAAPEPANLFGETDSAAGAGTVPVRIAEGFRLRFYAQAPEAREEVAVRRFGRLLARMETTWERGVPIAEVERQVRLLKERVPDYGESHEPIRIDQSQADEALQAALRVWVTEVRPELLVRSGENRVDEDPGVLVAVVRFRVGLDGRAEDVCIEEGERPYLLTTRLLHEYSLYGRELERSRRGEADFHRGRHLGAAPGPVLNFVTVTRLQGGGGSAFEFWFHLPGAGGNPGLQGTFEFDVYAELEDGTLERITPVGLRRHGRNRYLAELEHHAGRHGHFQFRFHLESMRLEGGGSVAHRMRGQHERFVGYDGHGLVTVYHADAAWAVGGGAWQSAASGAHHQQALAVEPPAPSAAVPAAETPAVETVPAAPAQETPVAEPEQSSALASTQALRERLKSVRPTLEPEKPNWLVRAWRWIMGTD